MTQTIQLINGDWNIDTRTGRPIMVQDKPKLEQDLFECLSIEVQSNGFGCGIDSAVAVESDPYSIQAQIQRAVRQGIGRFQGLQDQYQRADRSPAEQVAAIAAIRSVPVNPAEASAEAKTSYYFRVDVVSAAGAQASAEKVS